MSRQSLSTLHPADTPNSNIGMTTIAPANSNSPAAPSLESLLKSCGALQSVIRQKSETDEADNSEPEEDRDFESNNLNDMPFHAEQCECATETDVESRPAEADCTLHDANTLNRSSMPSPPVAGITPDTTDSVNLLSILKLMREESRASIQELKASQEAAAAGQSAVLKALFEVISRSSAVRDNVGESIEQKLFDFEERILQRIGHANSSADLTTAKDSKPPSGVQPSVSAAAKLSSGRSWEEIRNDLLLHGDARESQGETDIRESKDLANVAALHKSNSREAATLLEVPEFVDPDELTDVELREVFLEREEFISALISRLRQSHQQSSGHLPAEKLTAMGELLPEDLAVHVMQTLQQLDELARIGELELSLERARLSRQVSKLEESRLLLEHHARQLGLTLTDDGNVSTPKKSANRGTSSRRWLSKLGFGQ